MWELLIHLHEVHYEAVEKNIEVPNEINLGDLWLKDPKALVAYGLLAVPIPGWEKVSFYVIHVNFFFSIYMQVKVLDYVRKLIL